MAAAWSRKPVWSPCAFPETNDISHVFVLSVKRPRSPVPRRLVLMVFTSFPFPWSGPGPWPPIRPVPLLWIPMELNPRSCPGHRNRYQGSAVRLSKTFILVWLERIFAALDETRGSLTSRVWAKLTGATARLDCLVARCGKVY